MTAPDRDELKLVAGAYSMSNRRFLGLVLFMATHGRPRLALRTLWYLRLKPTRRPELSDDNLPFCTECGERNVVVFNGEAIWLDEWHADDCWRPIHRAVKARYIRRFGERAARRRGGWGI